jgi:hypothetical protein
MGDHGGQITVQDGGEVVHPGLDVLGHSLTTLTYERMPGSF